jgi:hypothetical protein
VEKQSGWRRTMQGGHGESCQDQGGVNCLAHGPANLFCLSAYRPSRNFRTQSSQRLSPPTLLTVSSLRVCFAHSSLALRTIFNH